MDTSQVLFVYCVNRNIWNHVAIFNMARQIELRNFCGKTEESVIFYKGSISNILFYPLSDHQLQLPSLKYKSQAQS